MSEQQPEDQQSADQQSADHDIPDDQLPEDLQPSEDNPLARHPGQSGDEDDEIGADREGEAETAPLTEEDADYGGAGSGDS